MQAERRFFRGDERSTAAECRDGPALWRRHVESPGEAERYVGAREAGLKARPTYHAREAGLKARPTYHAREAGLKARPTYYAREAGLRPALRTTHARRA